MSAPIRAPRGACAIYLRSAPFRPLVGVVTHSGPKAFRIRIGGKTRQYRTADIGAWSKEIH